MDITHLVQVHIETETFNSLSETLEISILNMLEPRPISIFQLLTLVYFDGEPIAGFEKQRLRVPDHRIVHTTGHHGRILATRSLRSIVVLDTIGEMAGEFFFLVVF